MPGAGPHIHPEVHVKDLLIRIVVAILGAAIIIVIVVIVAVTCGDSLTPGYHPAPWEQELVE